MRCLAALPLLLATLLGAAEPALRCAGEPLSAAAARLDVALPDTALLLESANAPVVMALATTGPAAVRQALAHACGAWLAPDQQGRWILTRSRQVPLGRLQVRVVPSALPADAGLERQVAGLMEPWIGPQGGVAFQPADGSWTATTDAAGHARLIALLSVLERPQPWAPHRWLPAAPTASGPALAARPWPALAEGLCASWGVSVSVTGGLGDAAPAIAAGPASGLPGQFAAAGLAAAWIDGVLCVGRQEPRPALHPGLRRRLAAIPTPHLTRDAAATALAARLRIQEAACGWDQPGFGIVSLGTGLLVAGDEEAIHRVLDALARSDRGSPDQRQSTSAPPQE